MGVFTGCCIALELGTSLNFKKKQEIRKLITENDGIISFIITKKCNFLVTTDGAERAKDSFKCRTAVKFNIPVVSVDFLYDSVANSRLSDPEAFYVIGETKKQLLTRGVIPLSKPSSATVKAKKQFQLNWNAVKSWTDSSNDAPDFHSLETFEIARSTVLQKPQKTEFCVIELHVATGNKSATTDYESGIVLHVIDTSHPAKARKEYRCGKTLEEGIAIYSRLHQIHAEPPHGYVRAQKPYPPNIGSAKFQKAQLSVATETVATIDTAVLGLVDVIWTEATGRLDDVLAVAVSNIKVEQVEKAESVLLEIKQLLDSNGGNRDNEAKQRIVELSDEFYSHLPHNNEHRTTIDNKKDIATKQRLCQLVLDVVSVSESTGWSQRCSALAKYRALRCHVTHVSPDTTEYNDIVGRAHSERMDRIVNIFRVSRPIEDIEFRADVDNHQLMCHASQVENFVGILSRGLLLPKVVVDDLGGKRTDPGMLGHGIYFADSPSTSVGYSHPSRCKGTRLMALCEVALGSCYETTQHDLSLTAPPAGYDSVHGVGASGGITSEFKDDEFVVYSTDRQRLRYLVEFTVPGDSPVDRPLDLMAQSTDLEQPPEVSAKEQVSLSDVKDAKSPLDEVKAGLVSNTDAAVPLRSVHVRAKLVDLAAQVVVLQEYHNDSHLPIEAKFVFPLDEMSVVCGFEAFINGKHVVGVVKEKETAHREYKQAVEAGHGAYLMDQDKEQPDVFTVSVGNLPAFCTAVIKITYVAELLMDGEFISFRVPGSVAPWTERSAMGTQTQSITKTVGAAGSISAMTIQVSIEMPFDIRTIHSPTHRLRIKKTETKAVVEMANNQSITDGGFQLLILLAELHVPRMWVEQHPDNTDSRACMLAFYPEFETSQSTAAESSPEFEAIFFIDLSNSMKDTAVSDAKKVLLLALHHLPSICTFNIVRFGTDYDELFPCSRQKTDDNVTVATDYVNSSSATLGNTDVYRPLHTCHLLSRLICSADECRLPVNVFIVSDGHLSNAEQTFHAARSNAQHTRIFTLGVGDAANRHALRSLAHVGGGSFEFFDRKFKSKWEGRVKGQLTKAAQPSLSSIEVEWQTFSDDNSSSAKLVQAPASIMALFNGCRQVVYGFVPNCNQATLKAVINNQQVSTVVSTSDLSVTTGNMLHQLTARAVIHDWQQGLLSDDCLQQQITKKNTKNYIIKLSIDYSIVTEFTSFVAIETRDKDEVIDVTSNGEVLKLIQQNSVDALDYMGWQVEEKSELELTGERLRNRDYVKLTKELVENYMESVDEFSSKCDPRRLQVYVDVFHWAKATQQPELKDEQMLEHFKEQYDEIISQLDTLSEESYAASAALLSELKDILEELHIPESTSSESSSFDLNYYKDSCGTYESTPATDELYEHYEARCTTPKNLAKGVTLNEFDDELYEDKVAYSLLDRLGTWSSDKVDDDDVDDVDGNGGRTAGEVGAGLAASLEAQPDAAILSSASGAIIVHSPRMQQEIESIDTLGLWTGSVSGQEGSEVPSVGDSFDIQNLSGLCFFSSDALVSAAAPGAPAAKAEEESELSALFSSQWQTQENYGHDELRQLFFSGVKTSKQAVSGASANKDDKTWSSLQQQSQQQQHLNAYSIQQQSAASDKLSEIFETKRKKTMMVMGDPRGHRLQCCSMDLPEIEKAPEIIKETSLRITHVTSEDSADDDAANVEEDAAAGSAEPAFAFQTLAASNVRSVPRESIMQSSKSSAELDAPISTVEPTSSRAEVAGVHTSSSALEELRAPPMHPQNAVSTVCWRRETIESPVLPRQGGPPAPPPPTLQVHSAAGPPRSGIMRAAKFIAPPPTFVKLASRVPEMQRSFCVSKVGGAPASSTGIAPPPPPPRPRASASLQLASPVSMSRAYGAPASSTGIAPPPLPPSPRASASLQLASPVSLSRAYEATASVTGIVPPPPPQDTASLQLAAPGSMSSAYGATASVTGIAPPPPPPTVHPATASLQLASSVPMWQRCSARGSRAAASNTRFAPPPPPPPLKYTDSFQLDAPVSMSRSYEATASITGFAPPQPPPVSRSTANYFQSEPVPMPLRARCTAYQADAYVPGIAPPSAFGDTKHSVAPIKCGRPTPRSSRSLVHPAVSLSNSGFAFNSATVVSGASLFGSETEKVSTAASVDFASRTGKIAEPSFGSACQTDQLATGFASGSLFEPAPPSLTSQAADINRSSPAPHLRRSRAFLSTGGGPASGFAFGTDASGSGTSLFGTAASVDFASDTAKMAEPLFGSARPADLACSGFAAGSPSKPARPSFTSQAADVLRTSPAYSIAFGSSAAAPGGVLSRGAKPGAMGSSTFGFGPRDQNSEPHLFGALSGIHSCSFASGKTVGPTMPFSNAFHVGSLPLPPPSYSFTGGIFGPAEYLAPVSADAPVPCTAPFNVDFGVPASQTFGGGFRPSVPLDNRLTFGSFVDGRSSRDSLIKSQQMLFSGPAAFTRQADSLLKYNKETQTALTLLPATASDRKKLDLGGRKMSDEMLKNLFSVVHYDYTHGDIYWDLTVCQLILVDEVACTSALRRAGITTLGENCAKDASCLLATLMVLFHVLEWSRPMFTNSSCLTAMLRDVASGNSLDESTVRAEYHRGLMDAARYCLRMDLQRPLVYTTLELGLSWSDVVFDFLHDFKADASHSCSLETNENLKNIYCCYLDFIV